MVAASSCARSSLPYETSSAVSERLLTFRQQGPQGAVQPLSNFTDFDWDTVYFFLEGTKKKVINRKTSSRFFKKDDDLYIQPGALLIFKSKNEVVHALAAVPPIAISGSNGKAYKYEEAMLYAHTKNPGPYRLRFTD